MNIQDTEIVDLVSQIEEVEQKLLAHPMHKVLLHAVFLYLLILHLNIKK